MIRIHRCLYVNRDRIGGVQLGASDTRIDVFRNDPEGLAIVRFGATLCDTDRTVADQFADIVEQINNVDFGHGPTN
jgi:hypothetical protein